MAIARCLLVVAVWTSTSHAHPGVGIVEDSRGNIFFTDLKQVWMIAPDGKKSVAVQDVHTHELCVDVEDNVFGEHLWYEGDAIGKWRHRVWRRRPNGNVSDVVSDREGFLRDYSFVRDRDGNMYWADRGQETVIKKTAENGKTVTHATGDFRDVRWMIATADGTLYLIDRGDLKRISADGKASTIATKLSEHKSPPAAASQRHYQMGLWTDDKGSVYVAVAEERLVLKVATDGSTSVAARTGDSVPPASGVLDQAKKRLSDAAVESWSPSGGMFDRRGNLWLLEYSSKNNVRARRINREGTEDTF
jgi:hypothetical protein